MSQLSVAKESYKVIVNQLNEAIILRMEDGNLGYCNRQGIRLIKPLTKGLFGTKYQLGKFL